MEDVKNVQLLPCLVRLAQLQSDNLDRLALREAVETAQDIWNSEIMVILKPN